MNVVDSFRIRVSRCFECLLWATIVTSHSGKAFDQLLSTLDTCGPIILPALLMCDFGHLADEVKRLEDAGALGLHLDVMDGRFVPQLTYGKIIVEAVRKASTVPLEVHLMIQEPDQVIEEYVAAGSDIITVHIEALKDPFNTLQTIQSLGAKAHLAISPNTALERVEPFLDRCDGILVMSVEPGFGGQSFNPVAINKLSGLRALRERKRLSFLLGVDGGISVETAGLVSAAGAQLLVAGSSVLCSPNYQQAIQDLERQARSDA